MKILEMTTLASVGQMPALPLGMAYPKVWRTVKGSKRVKFKPVSRKKKKKKIRVVMEANW